MRALVPSRSTSGKEGFIWAHSLGCSASWQARHGGKCEGVGHIVCNQETERTNVGAQRSLFDLVQDPNPGAIHIQVGLLSSLLMAEVCFHGGSKSSHVVTEDEPSQREIALSGPECQEVAEVLVLST